jgi:hypothetical protein
MNGLDQNLTSYVTIGRKHWDVPVRVELRPYLDFNCRINLQLRHLLACWFKQAAPASRKIHRVQRK